MNVISHQSNTAQQSLLFSDAALPTKAPSPEANVTEIIIAQSKADNIQMLLPMLTRLNQERRWLAWIDPPTELINSWKQQDHAKAGDIMVIRSTTQVSALELCERALAAGTSHAVVMWTNNLAKESFEMLERASAIGDSHGIVLRTRY